MTPNEQKTLDALTAFVCTEEVEHEHRKPFQALIIPPKKKMSSCTRFLLLVVLPVSAPLLLMVTAMALVEFFHIYLDFLRPLWVQLPSGILYGFGLAIPGALVGCYISCRLAQRRKK